MIIPFIICDKFSVIHVFLVWLRTGSNTADINWFQIQAVKEILFTELSMVIKKTQELVVYPIFCSGELLVYGCCHSCLYDYIVT